MRRRAMGVKEKRNSRVSNVAQGPKKTGIASLGNVGGGKRNNRPLRESPPKICLQEDGWIRGY